MTRPRPSPTNQCLSNRCLAPVGRTALALLALVGAVDAQDAGPSSDRLRVRVTAVAAPDSVWLDRGRNSGLAPGVEVELQPPGEAPLRARVREVTASRSRAEVLDRNRELPPVGTPGEAEVRGAGGELQGGEVATPQRADGTVQHPPWTLDEPVFDTDQPLLAPAFGRGAAARPTEWNGRLFGQALYNRDTSTGRGAETLLARLGTRLEVTNPGGHGGRLRFEGELTRRSIDRYDAGTEHDDRGRLDWLSYAVGDDELASWRLEAGRFVSQYVPELGLLDGLEAARRLDKSWTVGAGAGALPLPFPSRMSGEDIGIHAFTQWLPRAEADGRSNASATFGVQKTWHQGAPDRDLLFGRFDWSPSETLRFDGSFKVDFYSGKDTLKDDVELTEAWLGTTWRPADPLRLGLTASSYRWAQLLRDELYFAAPELVRNGHVERLSPRAELRATDDLRLRGRVDWWQDQDGSGTGGELGADWYDLFGNGSMLSVSGFRTAGSFQEGPGLRARAGFRVGQHMLTARYETVRWRTVGLITGDETYTQHRIGLSADLLPTDSVQVQIDAEWVVGDDTEGLFLGTWIQHRW